MIFKFIDKLLEIVFYPRRSKLRQTESTEDLIYSLHQWKNHRVRYKTGEYKRVFKGYYKKLDPASEPLKEAAELLNPERERWETEWVETPVVIESLEDTVSYLKNHPDDWEWFSDNPKKIKPVTSRPDNPLRGEIYNRMMGVSKTYYSNAYGNLESSYLRRREGSGNLNTELMGKQFAKRDGGPWKNEVGGVVSKKLQKLLDEKVSRMIGSVNETNDSFKQLMQDLGMTINEVILDPSVHLPQSIHYTKKVVTNSEKKGKTKRRAKPTVNGDR